MGELPDSAISSWGGFVYQGKIALFHSIKLLVDGSFEGKEVKKFALQLDSTDDFAIYVEGNAISVHQVKAKASKYRSTFEKALNKSSKICIDCCPNTKRYFHIANEIDDCSDYENEKKAIVEFYKYGEDSYCKLERVEEVIKEKIEEYLNKNSLESSFLLIEQKYHYLSELITSKVIEIHSLVHQGVSQNKAAYENTIDSDLFLEILITDFNLVQDLPYEMKRLRNLFADTLENYVCDSNEYFTNVQINLFNEVFKHIYKMDDDELEYIKQSIRLSSSEQIRNDDINTYAEIITDISATIVLVDLPHYSKEEKRYLPTALKLQDRRAESFKTKLIEQLRSNNLLVKILYEYNILISGSEVHKAIEINTYNDSVARITIDKIEAENHILRELPIKVICTSTAQSELNNV
ncbi:ABC-three component system protein [Acinetobacter baumannii]